MKVTLPVTVVAAQWALLTLLALLVLIMYRQLAYLMQVRKSSSAEGGLDVGARAPNFGYKLFRSAVGETQFQSGKEATLMLFADPGCASCGRALSAMEKALAEKSAAVEGLVVTDAQESLIASLDEFRDTSLPVGLIQPGLAYDLFRVGITPFFFAIGVDGRVRAKMSTDNSAEITALIRSCLGESPADSNREPTGRQPLVIDAKNGGR